MFTSSSLLRRLASSSSSRRFLSTTTTTTIPRKAFSSSSSSSSSSSTTTTSTAAAASSLLLASASLFLFTQDKENKPAAAAAASAASAGAGGGGGGLHNNNGKPIHAQYAPVYDIPIKNKQFPKQVPCFIEVSKGSRMKYEWDSDVGLLRLDRVLHSAVFYPFDYGFIPQTLCEDGDPLDVLVMGDSALEPGCIVDVRVLGYMVMEDEKGRDEKVLAVLTKDPRMQEMKTLRDVPEHILREISCFFEQYKTLEREKWVKVGGWKGTQDTHDLILQTHQSYEAKKAKAEAPAI